jgi:hypothetical protein
MAAITLKAMPPALYTQLKRLAIQNRRSLNQEAPGGRAQAAKPREGRQKVATSPVKMR